MKLIFILVILCLIAYSEGRNWAKKKRQKRDIYQGANIHEYYVRHELPNVVNCWAGATYIYNHIVYACGANEQHVRTLTPIGCVARNLDKNITVPVGYTYNELYFTYKCKQIDEKMVYKAINCRYNGADLQPFVTMRLPEMEAECIEDKDWNIKVMVRRHNPPLCEFYKKHNPGSEKKCPGYTEKVFHPDEGHGTAVTWDKEKNMVI
uniref:Uncharacterized protein n=1 Tax=Acrobeloides nanus TaxID=290746 RepID=A0A914D1G1_9BILA